MISLTIIRHAKTNQGSITGKDFDRALLPRGKAQCKDLVEYFKSSDIHPDLIIVSAAKRAQETFKLIHPSFQGIQKIDSNECYLASHQELLNLLWNVNAAGNILIVGHNYGISDLASYITGQEIDLRTSELIQIELPIDYWAELSNGHGTITHRFRSLS